MSKTIKKIDWDIDLSETENNSLGTSIPDEDCKKAENNKQKSNIVKDRTFWSMCFQDIKKAVCCF